MGLRIRTSLKLGKGLRLNLSRHPSIAVKSGALSANTRGRMSIRLAPGVSYETRLGGGSKRRPKRRGRSPATVRRPARAVPTARERRGGASILPSRRIDRNALAIPAAAIATGLAGFYGIVFLAAAVYGLSTPPDNTAGGLVALVVGVLLLRAAVSAIPACVAWRAWRRARFAAKPV